MRETKFIDKNRRKWAKYEAALRSDRQDPKLLSELYVHTTDDLSYSRTFYPNRSVRVYLNGLAQRTFLQIYRGRRGEAGRFLTFWTDELPRILFKNRRVLLLSLCLFLLSMLIGIISYRIDPQFAETILGDNYVEMTRQNIRNGDPMAVYKERGEFNMFLAITFNNIYVALQTFIMGAFFAVGTVVIMVSNGIMVGVFQYFFVAEGLFRESFLTIWVHGALEISSIVIAGAAGMVMGKGLLFPGTYSRLQAFGQSAREGVKIMLGTVPLFIVAGFLEGYFTRHTETPDIVRFFFIMLCFAFMLWYFWYYPRELMRKHPVSTREIARRRINPSNETPIDTSKIKMIGEIISDAFTTFRRRGPRIIGGLLLSSLVFCLMAFGLTDQPATSRFVFESSPLMDFYNIYVLTSTFGFERDLTFFFAVAIGIYLILLVGCKALDLELDPLRKPTGSQLMKLAVPAILLTGCFSLQGGWVALAVLLFLPFLLTYAYITYRGDGNFKIAFRYVYTHINNSYGLFILMGLLGLFGFILLDTAVSRLLFNLLNWIIPTQGADIYFYNIVIQAGLYWFYFSLILITWFICMALNLHSVSEQEEAHSLLERINNLGQQRKLRGLELE